MLLIRNFIADHIIYQSKFIKDWWEEFSTISKNNYSIILNGSSINENGFKEKRTQKDIIITCVEGTIQDDPLTRFLIKSVDEFCDKYDITKGVEIYGRADLISYKLSNLKNIEFKGSLSRKDLQKIINKENRIFFLLELNPPCPNSLIEAICVGMPSVGLNTGSFLELAGDSCVPIQYEEDHWSLELPSGEQIHNSLSYAIDNFEDLSGNAYKRSLDLSSGKMCKQYLDLICSMIKFS